MWFIGCLAMVLIAASLYGLFFGFKNPRGNSAEAKQQHDNQFIIWWIVAMIGLPVGCAILEAVGRS